jgi:hypothetical protein
MEKSGPDITPEQWQAFFKFRADDETHRACIEALSDPDAEMSKWLKLVQKRLRSIPISSDEGEGEHEERPF